MDSINDSYFSPDHATARARFLAAVHAAGGSLESLELSAKGPSDEPLFIDIAWFGADAPKRVLLHSSGVHGVEGFSGSAIQLQWLVRGLPDLPEDSAIVIAHIINPYGMAWLRRFNENNVDLNRNFFAEDERYSGAPEGYRELDSSLNPKSPPSQDFFYLKAGLLVARHGMTALKQSIAGGQYENSKGLFFGGRRLEEGPRKLQAFVAERLKTAHEVTVVDIHTGLGPYGEDTLLVFAGDEGSEIYQEMKKAYGERVAPLDPEASVAYRIRGAYDSMFARALPNAKVRYVCQEFGTYHGIRVLKALREESRWAHYGEGGVDHPAKLALKEAFQPADRDWGRAVLERGAVVIEQALGLAGIGLSDRTGTPQTSSGRS